MVRGVFPLTFSVRETTTDFDGIFGGPGEVVMVYLFREDGYLEEKLSSDPVVDAILEEMAMRVRGGASGSSGLG
jgi:hypothetical protein